MLQKHFQKSHFAAGHIIPTLQLGSVNGFRSVKMTILSFCLKLYVPILFVHFIHFVLDDLFNNSDKFETVCFSVTLFMYVIQFHVHYLSVEILGRLSLQFSMFRCFRIQRVRTNILDSYCDWCSTGRRSATSQTSATLKAFFSTSTT